MIGWFKRRLTWLVGVFVYRNPLESALVGCAKILCVALCYALVYAAEIGFDSNLYYALCSLAFSVSCIASAICGWALLSRTLFYYAGLLFVFSVINAVMVFNSGFYALEWIYWDAAINLCLIIQAYEFVIIALGGLNVTVGIFSMRNNDRNSGSNFNARMDIRKWA